MENKKWKVKFSKEAEKKLDDLPDDVYGELVEIIKGFKEGKLDPEEIGNPVDFKELKVKLKCPQCHSGNVEWILDKNSDEVDLHCLECNENFWMNHKEYKKTVKRNPDKIVKEKINKSP